MGCFFDAFLESFVFASLAHFLFAAESDVFDVFFEVCDFGFCTGDGLFDFCNSCFFGVKVGYGSIQFFLELECD